MFDHYKKRLRNLLRHSENSFHLAEDNLALQQLLKMFPQGTLLPLTAWSLSPFQTLHICNEMLLGGKRRVVEFGMGFSTLCLAQLIKNKGWDAHIYTVDNSQEWVDTLMQTVRELELEPYITPVIAPMVATPAELAYKGQSIWYDTAILREKLGNVPPFELVVVDGPYGGGTPFARYSALPFIQPYLASDYVVFLDDTNRPHETEIAQVWTNKIQGKAFKHRVYNVIKPNPQAFDLAPYRVNS